MAKSRKDSRGYVLRTGESQRKDGRYSYSYTDLDNAITNLRLVRDNQIKSPTVEEKINDAIEYAKPVREEKKAEEERKKAEEAERQAQLQREEEERQAQMWKRKHERRSYPS